jgi:hypothetical protein
MLRSDIDNVEVNKKDVEVYGDGDTPYKYYKKKL